MNFQLDKSIELLLRTPKIYRSLLHGLGHGYTQINEGPDTWNAFDIVGHLIHGEKTDWIPRSRIILSDDRNKTFEPFDRYAQEKLSAGKTMEELIDEFEELRTINLEELRSWELTEADLRKKGIHPELGEVTLKELISTWTVHDMAHLNQISRIFVRHYSQDVGPWSQYLSLLKK